MNEFMLASCEAEEILKKGDTLTCFGGDYVFSEKGDCGYLYVQGSDAVVDPLEVTHVNGIPKRFGVKGFEDSLLKYVSSSGMGCDEGLIDFTRKELITMYGRYWNMDHPEVKEEFKWLLEGGVYD